MNKMTFPSISPKETIVPQLTIAWVMRGKRLVKAVQLAKEGKIPDYGEVNL